MSEAGSLTFRPSIDSQAVRGVAYSMNNLLENIAKQHLDIATLKERHCDSLDFHEVSVWQLRKALEAAYRLGLESREVNVQLRNPDYDGPMGIFTEKNECIDFTANMG